jgi:hypothetical protein
MDPGRQAGQQAIFFAGHHVYPPVSVAARPHWTRRNSRPAWPSIVRAREFMRDDAISNYPARRKEQSVGPWRQRNSASISIVECASINIPSMRPRNRAERIATGTR